MPGPYIPAQQKSAPRVSAWGAIFMLPYKLLVQVDQLGQVLVASIGDSLVLLEQGLGAIREGASL